MKLLADLPRRIMIVPSGCWMKTLDVLELLRLGRAQQKFSANGDFIGIELIHRGPLPSLPDNVRLPAAELPGLIFQPPANAQPVMGYVKFSRGEIAYA